MDYGGNCPDADKRSDGYTYDDCSNKFAQTERQVCTQQYSEPQCVERHGVKTDGFLDSVLDTVSAINSLSDLDAIDPDCFKVDSCGASCTFGFKSAKSLLVEFVLELDVQSASRGTATFEGSANGKSLIKGNHVFKCVCLLLQDGTREEPGTLTQGAPVFPGSSRLGIETKTPGWLVQDPTTRPIGDLIPTIGGSGAHPWRGWDP